MKGKAYSEDFKEQVLREVEDTGNVALVARNNNMI
jgi:transposase-like protein